jgi:hypothetical protein
LDGEAATIEIEDETTGGEELVWSFPLAPGARVEVEGGRVVARWASAWVSIETDDPLEWSVEDGWVSPAYGVRERAPVLRGRSGGPRRMTTFALRVSATP